MKKIAFVIAVLFACSCTRHNLNYQSSHPNGAADRDNYPAPQTQSSGGVQNNYSNGNNYNNSQAQVDYSSPSYQTFYDDLSPYGYWVNYPAYGYTWVPNAGPGFTPYGTNGNWVYTSYGWTWNSGYDWGWAPFHYGRWFMDPTYGWMWVPGNLWAPAWVSWGSCNGNYGWAPVEPGVIVSSGYSPPQQYWRFVPAQNITAANVSSYYVSNNSVQHNNIVPISNSSSYNEHTYFSGPQREEVETATGSKINAVVVHESNKPTPATTNNHNLSLYRPVINQSTGLTAKPAKLSPVETLKPVKTNTEPVYNHASPKPAVQPNNNVENAPPPAREPVHTQTQTEPAQHHQVNNKPVQQGPKPAPKPKNNNQPQPKAEPQKKG